MVALETKNLCKKYGDKIVVNNLNLEVNEGELFALLGVNGAGKTTTIKMLSCLIKPTSGDAFLLGNSIITKTFEVKEITNVSPQETAIAENLSVQENLEMICAIYMAALKADKKTINDTVNQIIEEFKLEEVRHQKSKTLSGGWQRRLSIAMALISRPKILFLDEPTLGLDVIARRELWNIIKSLKGKVTIILTTHYLEEVEALSDRVGIMAKGILKAIGTVNELNGQTGKQNFEETFVEIATTKENIE